VSCYVPAEKTGTAGNLSNVKDSLLFHPFRCLDLEGIMEANVGSADRIIRVIAGLALLSLLFLLNGDARGWGLIGIVPLATSAFRFFPLCRLLRSAPVS